MSSGTLTSEIGSLHARLDAVMNELLSVDLHAAGDDELLGLWRSVESARRRLDPVEYRLIEESTARGLPCTHGCASPKSFIASLLTISPAQAAGRVRDAASFGPRRDLQQQPLPAIFTHAAVALGEGAITAQAARAIQQVIERLPDEITAEMGDALERQMVGYARGVDAAEARKFAQLLGYALDQDGQYNDLAAAHKRRGIRVVRRDDGTATVTGDLTCELAEVLQTVLDAFAAPAPKADGTPDPRSHDQRRHDGMLDALRALLQSGATPDTAGCRTTVILHADADRFAANEGSMTTGHGYSVPTDTAKTWLEPEARAVLVLLSRTKGITAYSSVQRLFTEQQRLAMQARDRGCSFPGCGRPAAWTQAHHVIEFQKSRRTRVDDGALVCGEHHRTFEQLGWTNEMRGGRPVWIPPAWVDPQQTPRANTRHHPPQL